MEFAWLAIESRTVVVVDAIGDIRGLLYLCEFYASADSVYASGWEIEHIAFVYLMLGKDFADGAVSNAFFVFLWCYLLLEASIEV